MKRTYRQMKQELEDIVAWFSSGEVDVDEALQKHAEAEKLLKEIEAYLTDKEQRIKKIA